jgi:glucose-1-phosphate adenylyltransferase
MNNVMGIINLVENTGILGGIASHRPVATIPFGGNYRLMDFALSGMVNSGVTNVGVLAPIKQRSLLDHLRSGKDWHLTGKRDGLIVLPPEYEPNGLTANMDVRSLYTHLDFIRKSRQDYVIITNPDIVGHFDFRAPFRFHQETKADVTLFYKTEHPGHPECCSDIHLDLRPDGRVAGIGPVIPKESACFFFGTFILGKELLTRLVNDCHASGKTGGLLQGIAERLDSLQVRAYSYPGYVARIHCLHSYYHRNMELLHPETWKEIFAQPGRIYTKVRDEAPARYGLNAKVTNTIAATGCRIQGTVEGSILFRRVVIGESAHVRSSILMPGAEVAAGALVSNVICDKDVRITAGACVEGEYDHPLVLRKGTVV